jgi:DNA-binding transcriptional regulator YiaG
MTSLHQYVIDSIRTTMYDCRTDVLHQLFCVNGNGLDWEGGELVSRYRDRDPRPLSTMLADEAKELAEIRHFGNDEYYRREVAITRSRIRQENMKLQFRYDNAEDLAYVTWPDSILLSNNAKRPSIYPLCEYACMVHVPDDVQSDWLAGVREMISVVFASTAQARPHHRRIQPFSPTILSAVQANLNLSADILAAKLDISVAILNQWENGESTPSQQEFSALIDLEAAYFAKQEHEHNIAIADKVLQDLHSRFGGDGFSSYGNWVARQIMARKNLAEMISRIISKKE